VKNKDIIIHNSATANMQIILVHHVGHYEFQNDMDNYECSLLICHMHSNGQIRYHLNLFVILMTIRSKVNNIPGLNKVATRSKQQLPFSIACSKKNF